LEDNTSIFFVPLKSGHKLPDTLLRDFLRIIETSDIYDYLGSDQPAWADSPMEIDESEVTEFDIDTTQLLSLISQHKFHHITIQDWQDEPLFKAIVASIHDAFRKNPEFEIIECHLILGKHSIASPKGDIVFKGCVSLGFHAQGLPPENWQKAFDELVEDTLFSSYINEVSDAFGTACKIVFGLS